MKKLLSYTFPGQLISAYLTEVAGTAQVSLYEEKFYFFLLGSTNKQVGSYSIMSYPLFIEFSFAVLFLLFDCWLFLTAFPA